MRPTVLYTCGYPDNPDGTRHRPYETLLPLSRRLGLNIHVPVLKTEGPILVREHLLKDEREDVLICWEHKNIPPIAAALAQVLGLDALPAVARVWPENDFHSALIFTSTGESWQVSQVSEDMLGVDA